MKDIILKSFVIPFYKAYAGLFLLLIIFFGVFMRANDHVLLAQFIVQSPYGLAFVISLFTIYTFLETRFQIELKNQNNYLVFYQMGLFKFVDFYKASFFSWSSNNLLLIIYTVFLSLQAYYFSLWNIIILLWMVIIFLFVISSSWIFHKLKKPLPDQKVRSVQFKWFKTFKISYGYWFTMHLFQHRPMLLIFSKFLSLIMLNIFFSSFYSGDYDMRWLQFAVICSSFINYLIWSEKLSFESEKLPYFLNMPLSLNAKAANHLSSFLQILIPELIFLLYQVMYLSNFISALELIILFFALNAALYGFLKLTTNETLFLRNTFILFFSLLFMVQFGIPALFIIVASILFFLHSCRSPYIL